MYCSPVWHYGVPVLARRAKKFDAEEVFSLLAKYGIRNAFMPPTALKMMRQVKDPKSRHDFSMRTIGSGGEALGEELLAWGEEVMGLTINEFYGQTEVNLVVGSCSEVMEIRPGAMGKAIPGHVVEVVDEAGIPLAAGRSGGMWASKARIRSCVWDIGKIRSPPGKKYSGRLVGDR